MEKVAIDDTEPSASEIDIDRRGLSDPLGTTHVAINRYRLAPGEGLPGGLHAHADQEEVFVVVEGEATFETMDGEVTVGAGEAIRFAPGEFQSGKNNSDGELVTFAMGAPRDSQDVRIPFACPDCDHDDVRLDFGETDLTFVCPECGGERVPTACPECDCDDVRVSPGDEGRPVAVCRDCGTEFDAPPVRDGW